VCSSDLNALALPIAGGAGQWGYPFSLANDWYDQIWAWVAGLWDWITGNIWNGINDVIRLFPSWFEWMRDRVVETVDAVWGWVEHWSRWLGNWLQQLIENAWASLGDWSARILAAVQGLGGEAWAAVSSLWDWMRGETGRLYAQGLEFNAWVRSNLPGIERGVISYLAGDFVHPEGALQRMFNDNRGTLEGKIDDARDYFSQQVIDPWTDWLRSTTTQFIGGIQSTWNGITGWLSGAWSWALGIIKGPVLDAASGALGWLGDRFGDLGNAAIGLITGHLHSFSPVVIDEVPNKTTNLLKRIGISAAGLVAMTLGGELLHPLKQLGLGRVAAMLWNFTRYDTIMDAYVRPISQGTIGIPMRWYINDYLRPWRPATGDLLQLRKRNFIDDASFRQGMAWQGYPDDWIEAFARLTETIPTEGTLGTMYAKKEISEAKLRESLDKWGFASEWQDVFTRHLWMDPRLGEIIRISQISPPNPDPDPEASAWLAERGYTPEDPADWWYLYKLAKAGYEPVDVRVLVGVAKMGVVRREQTMFFEAARRLRRDGFIDDRRYEELIAEAWRAKSPVEFRRAATQLDVEYDRKESLLQITRRAYSRGAIAAGEALQLLGRLGMDGTAAAIQLLEEKVGLLPRTRLALATAMGGDIDDGD